MAISPIDLEVNCFQWQSLRSHEFLEMLRSFKKLLDTSIGPGGKVKIIESTGGIAVLTTSSKRLIEWIELDNPLLHVVTNAMKSQSEAYSDFGLFTGLTSTTLLQNVLNDRFPCSTVSSLIKYHSSITLLLIDRLRTCLKVDILSLECLVKIVETVISSKPLCCDPAVVNVSSLAVCTVGGFIRGISENLGSLGKIAVVVDEGPMKEPPTNFTGLLYDSPDCNQFEKWITNLDGERKVMVVLFAVNLTSSNIHSGNNSGENFTVDEVCCQIQEETFLKKMERTCELFLDAGVRVFACQKVIHPHVKCYLSRRGGLALERMGKDLADSFSLLTGAIPLGHPTFDELPIGCIGELDSVKLLERGEKTYLRLERDEDKSRGIVTILASGAGEQQAAELKVVINQSLQTLCHLFSKPYVLPGSGCLEAWLVVQLQNKILSDLDEQCEKHNCSSVEMLAVLKWFRNTFVAVSRRISGYSDSCFIVDSFYNHSWHSEDASHCACGLLTKELCDGCGAEWIDLEIETSEEKLINLLSSKNFSSLNADHPNEESILLPKVNIPKYVHVDICCSKLNALSLALEICQSILSVGMVVY